MSEHGFDRVDRDPEGRYIAVCACGWRSRSAESAEAVLSEWDGHRSMPSTGAAGH